MPAYTRAKFSPALPCGASRRTKEIVGGADLWWRWPEAFEPGWPTVMTGGLVVAGRVEGIEPVDDP